MSNLNNIISITIKCFLQVFNFSRVTSTFIVLLTIFSAFESYLNIILSKIIVDGIFNNQGSLIVFYILLLLVLQVINLIIKAASSLINNRMQLSYSNHTDETLMNKLVGMNYLLKEDPSFSSRFSYEHFA